MSELNEGFFNRLARKLPGMKKQVAKAAQERKAKKNGTLPKPVCGICGKELSVKTSLILRAPIPRNCPACQGQLDGGCTAFVTIGKDAQFWIGKGAKAEFVGKTVVISQEQMSAILRADSALKAKEKESNESNQSRDIRPSGD